jgi:hypothetical protein
MVFYGFYPWLPGGKELDVPAFGTAFVTDFACFAAKSAPKAKCGG